MVWEGLGSLRRSHQPRSRPADNNGPLFGRFPCPRLQSYEGIQNGVGRPPRVLFAERRLADGGNGGNTRRPTGKKGRILPREEHSGCKGSGPPGYSERSRCCPACRRNGGRGCRWCLWPEGMARSLKSGRELYPRDAVNKQYERRRLAPERFTTFTWFRERAKRKIK